MLMRVCIQQICSHEYEYDDGKLVDDLMMNGMIRLCLMMFDEISQISIKRCELHARNKLELIHNQADQSIFEARDSR